MNIGELLAKARQLGVDRLDAQWLLCHSLQRTRAWLLANADHVLQADLARRVEEQLQQRATGMPLAYVLGETEFCGLRLRVTSATLVPRPETELLVDWAVELLATAPSQTAVDLGTGSGAIAVALATRRPGLHITATDASDAALAVAQGNARTLGLDLSFAQGDWWQPLAGKRFGLAAANPPYVAEGDPHLNDLQHEPLSALTAGSDGMADLRHIIAGARAHLLPGAHLLLEHGHHQGPSVQSLLSAAGFSDIETRFDLAGLPRCTAGRLCAGK